jgi:L-alanine-DL-glutamate epimerase-like enolase superfamily enzyme
MNRRDFLLTCGVAGPGALDASAQASAPTVPTALSGAGTPARIRWEKVRLELKHTWAIARGSTDHKDNVFAYYERDGATGVGEAGHLTAAGQTAEQTLAGLARLAPVYEQADSFAFAELSDKAAQVEGVTAPARAALDLALLDWVGRKVGQPVYRLFGLDPQRGVPTSFSLGLDSLERLQAKAREAAPYAILKVKLGGDNDEAVIRALREVTDKPIRVDANEAWRDKETALRRIEWLAGQGIELVEQPMPRDQVDDMRWIKARTAMILVADEAVHTSRDIPPLAGAFDGINIKLMKAGGLVEAWRMFAVARAHNFHAMMGCMIESSVAISAAVHLQSLARWLDLDGNLLLKADPFAGASFRDGRWWPSDQPGLGVTRRNQ